MTNFFLDELRKIYGDGRVIHDPQFVGECADTENLSKKQAIGFRKFNAPDIALILHCIVQINPSCSSTSSSCLT